MVKKINLAVLISGRGSNLQSIIDACAEKDFPAQIKVVISNEPDAYGLERARDAGILTEIIHHKSYPSRREFEEALAKKLAEYPIDLICLAGFMRVLTADFVSKWEGKMLNIHPSLLPNYPGLHTHERVLAGGDKESGCTIHFVTPGLDEGPTLLQRSVPVLGNDTPDILAARVLEQEHIAYPEAIRLIALGKVTYGKEHVVVAPAEPYIPAAKTAPAPSAPITEQPQPKPDVKSHTPAQTAPKTPPKVVEIKETPQMDHHHSANNAPDNAAIQEADHIWGQFTKVAMFTIVGVAGVLTFMALVLL